MTTLAETAFQLAFGDLSFEEVIALREGDAWRFFPGHDPQRFAHLLSTADLDAFLRTDAARSPRVSMADNRLKGSAGVPQDDFLLPDSTRVNLPNLFALFDGGASLVVSQFHELHPPLAAFCRGLEKGFLHAAQSNIYLTPPSAQGFRPHFDTHDVLVLQVEGSKTWRVWDGFPVEKPSRATPWENRYRSDGEAHAVQLKAGDLLYLPRGIMHDASTDDGASLHITIGFLEPSWGNILTGVVEALERELPELRGSVPTWRLGDPDAAAILAERLNPVLQALLNASLAERVAIAALDRVAQERLPLPARGLFPAPIEAATELRLADSMLHHLIPTDDGGATLRWYGGVMPLTAEELGWLQAMEEGAAAGSLGEGGIAFGRKLAALGLLER